MVNHRNICEHELLSIGWIIALGFLDLIAQIGEQFLLESFLKLISISDWKVIGSFIKRIEQIL